MALSAMRDDNNQPLAREHKAKRGNQRPGSSPKNASDERALASRWLSENRGIANKSRTERSSNDERAQMLEQAKLLELVHAAVRSGHVVLVGAEDTWEKTGKQVELLRDAPYKYFSFLTVVVMYGYAFLAAYLRSASVTPVLGSPGS